MNSNFVDEIIERELNEYYDIQDQMNAHWENMKEKAKPAPTILEGSIQRETQKAILFKYNDSENWLPKSQINIKKKKDSCVVEIPEWLWNKMNQIED